MPGVVCAHYLTTARTAAPVAMLAATAGKAEIVAAVKISVIVPARIALIIVSSLSCLSLMGAEF